MVVYVRQPLSKTARATRVALTPRTRQVKVEGHGAMLKRRRDDIVVTCMRKHFRRQFIVSLQLLVSDAGDAAWNYCGKIKI